MDLTTHRLSASHFGPPWTLPVGPLLSALVVRNAGSQWSLQSCTLALVSLGCKIVATLGGVELGLILSKVLVEGGSGTWAATLCLMTLCWLVIVALAYVQAFVRSGSQQS